MEDFDKELFSSLEDGLTKELEDNTERLIRDNWGYISKIAAGIYTDAIANGLPEESSEILTRQFIWASTEKLTGDRL